MPKNQAKCLLIRDKDDKKDLPFDVVGFSIYEYQLNKTDQSLNVWTAGGETSEPFGEVLKRFVDSLEADPEFRNAKPFEEFH